jgi:hypothetical protein
MALLRQFLACAVVAAVPGCATLAPQTPASTAAASTAAASTTAAGTAPATYAALAADATRVLRGRYYAGAGLWHMCLPAQACNTKNFDWGADSLTYALYLHWRLTHDPRVRPIMAALATTAIQYSPTDGGWSDVPEWDAIADVREYQVTGNPLALSKAEAAFAIVDSSNAKSFALGHCPGVDYQRPGGATHLKTLETDSNYIKAALLLYQETKDPAYLAKAERKYQAVREYFEDRRYSLYTVYVFDTGHRCTQVPGQYFASVNGNMIWAGADLAHLTGNAAYLAQAIATAHDVARHLGDATGVYADLQAENDVVEPLIEAMYTLATTDHQPFARAWLLHAASAAAGARTPAGTYGRFFDGPAPRAPVTAWQVNGGIALMITAAGLDPRGAPAPADPGYWQPARFVPDDQRLAGAAGRPVRIVFTGRAIAIIGTLGEMCCQAGHARVYIDGKPIFDGVGIWQDKSSGGRRFADSVLFAWRWPVPGGHTITVAPAPYNAKQGGTFFNMTGYYLRG